MPASTGKEKWMKITGPVTVIYIKVSIPPKSGHKVRRHK